MKRILYYDCFAGISGDMNLGALIDLGVDPDHLKDELEKLNIEGFHLDIKRGIRKGISGTKATVVIENQENEKHRHLRHITGLINDSTLSESIKKKSLAIFELIAVAEAKIHDISKEKVHFHEVGALDSIADIVGAAICQAYLKVDEIVSSPVQLGGGFVKCAHGNMPVPAPATSEIVKGMPVKTGLVDYEATTPTGAAILAATVDHFSAEQFFNITKTGYGIGSKDGDIPNVLRVFLAESEDYVADSGGYPEESDREGVGDVEFAEAYIVECNIDDMNPEWFEYVSNLLFEAGAVDVFLTPILMKRSRSANKLSVLSDKMSLAGMKEILFRHTSSIGLREYKVGKSMLRREDTVVNTKYGEISVKRSYYGGKIVTEKPEYEHCRQLASKHNVSLAEIQKEVYKNL